MGNRYLLGRVGKRYGSTGRNRPGGIPLGCGITLTPVERAEYEPAVVATRTLLDPQAFAEARTEGRTMALARTAAGDFAVEQSLL